MRIAIALLLTAILAAPAVAQPALLALPIQESTPPPADALILGESAPLPADRLRVEVDYLLWVLRSEHAPALLTTGPAGSTGALGAPGTSLLYGDNRLESRHDDRYNGVRGLVEYWFDPQQTTGINGSAFFLERDSSHFSVPWGARSVLAVPYVDATTGTNSSYVVAGPSPGIGNLTGAATDYSRIEFFGEDANGVFNLARTADWRLDGLVGGRFLQMRERLDLTEVSKVLPTQAVLYGLTDHFHTFDKFFGAQTGLQGEYRSGPWMVAGKLTMALGGDAQEIQAFGDRTYQTPQLKQVSNYGLFVLPSNRGTFYRGDLDFVTEVGVSVGYALSRRVTLRLGYNFIYWNNPVRPGDQIQPINQTQVSAGGLSGPLKPTMPFKEDAFWAQGLTAGLEVRW